MSEDTIDVIVYEQKQRPKPLLLAKVGMDSFYNGNPWIPSKEDLEKVQAHLENLVGDQYEIMVFHRGIEIQTFDTDSQVNVVEVKSLEDLVDESFGSETNKRVED